MGGGGGGGGEGIFMERVWNNYSCVRGSLHEKIRI